MARSTTSLIAETRLTSGLRNNRLWSDDEIVVALNDGYADLRDKLISKFSHWFRATYDFTLTSEVGGNVLDLTLVPMLEMVQGLDLLDSNGNPYTIDELGSFAERNKFSGGWPLGGGGGWSYNGFVGRNYMIDGTSFFVLPALNAGGNYRLIYTPMQENLAEPVTSTWSVTTNFAALDNSGALRFAFGSNPGDHPTFDDGMLGAPLTVTLESPNAAYNVSGVAITGPEPITAGSILDTAVPWPGGSFTAPATGTASVTYQPAGTVASLPQNLTPWARYIVLYAARTIRTSRKEEIADLELQWEQMSARVSAVGKQRAEGIRQAPITRGGGVGYYGGGRGP